MSKEDLALVEELEKETKDKENDGKDDAVKKKKEKGDKKDKNKDDEANKKKDLVSLLLAPSKSISLIPPPDDR